MAKKGVTVKGAQELDRFFAKLDDQIRIDAARTIMVDVARPVVRAIKAHVPKPGYPGDKPGLKALRDTIGYVIRLYSGYVLAVIGPTRPAGAHGYVVDQGHRMVVGGSIEHKTRGRTSRASTPQRTGAGRVVGFVEGVEFMKAGIEQSQATSKRTIEKGLSKALIKAAKKYL